MITVAEAHGDRAAVMHCVRGHTFRLFDANTDRHGTWCPKCGNSAHSYTRAACEFCTGHDRAAEEDHHGCIHPHATTKGTDR